MISTFPASGLLSMTIKSAFHLCKNSTNSLPVPAPSESTHSKIPACSLIEDRSDFEFSAEAKIKNTSPALPGQRIEQPKQKEVGKTGTQSDLEDGKTATKLNSMIHTPSKRAKLAKKAARKYKINRRTEKRIIHARTNPTFPQRPKKPNQSQWNTGLKAILRLGPRSRFGGEKMSGHEKGNPAGNAKT